MERNLISICYEIGLENVIKGRSSKNNERNVITGFLCCFTYNFIWCIAPESGFLLFFVNYFKMK